MERSGSMPPLGPAAGLSTLDPSPTPKACRTQRHAVRVLTAAGTAEADGSARETARAEGQAAPGSGGCPALGGGGFPGGCLSQGVRRPQTGPSWHRARRQHVRAPQPPQNPPKPYTIYPTPPHPPRTCSPETCLHGVAKLGKVHHMWMHAPSVRAGLRSQGGRLQQRATAQSLVTESVRCLPAVLVAYPAVKGVGVEVVESAWKVEAGGLLRNMLQAARCMQAEARWPAQTASCPASCAAEATSLHMKSVTLGV